VTDRGPDRHQPSRVRGYRLRLPLGSVSYENAVNERGERYLRPAPTVVNRLRAMRGPGESYSDVILKLAAQTA
jgi:hypothetical protein